MEHPELKFMVTPIGCDIAGYTPEEIAPMLSAAASLPNVYLPINFWKVILIINNRKMKAINVKEDLENWLVDYLIDTVNNLEVKDSDEFNKWAKSFEREEAAFVVGMEFGNDWGYDKRTVISVEEAEEYAQTLLKKILDNWYK